jgi:ATP-dependent DNA helicase RecQ
MKYQPEPTSLNQARAAFQKIWGYDDFRPPQGEIVSSLLAGKDTIIIMPTGGGKSICFQLPALLQTGLTLVVSPLVALMENQVQELRSQSSRFPPPQSIANSAAPTNYAIAATKQIKIAVPVS